MLLVLTLTSVIPLGFFKNKGGQKKKVKEEERVRRGKKRRKEGKEKRTGERDLQTDFYFHNSIIAQFKGEEGRM